MISTICASRLSDLVVVYGARRGLEHFVVEDEQRTRALCRVSSGVRSSSARTARTWPGLPLGRMANGTCASTARRSTRDATALSVRLRSLMACRYQPMLGSICPAENQLLPCHLPARSAESMTPFGWAKAASCSFRKTAASSIWPRAERCCIEILRKRNDSRLSLRESSAGRGRSPVRIVLNRMSMSMWLFDLHDPSSANLVPKNETLLSRSERQLSGETRCLVNSLTNSLELLIEVRTSARTGRRLAM